MLHWETADQDGSLDEAELEWAALWKALPKVVFSTTLSAVRGNARLASGSLTEEIERLRADPGESEIAIGGATLAAEAVGLDLIDEYRVMVYPVLVGGGTPYFPRRERRVDLESHRNPPVRLRRHLPPLPGDARAGSRVTTLAGPRPLSQRPPSARAVARARQRRRRASRQRPPSQRPPEISWAGTKRTGRAPKPRLKR